MKKRVILPFLLAAGLLGACGVNNDTPEEAAKTMMKGLTSGDTEIVNEVNHSDAMSFPTSHMIDLANDYGIVDKMDEGDFKYEVKEKKPNIVHVTSTKEGIKCEWNMRFKKEKDGYFFTGLGNY
ncbi:hypothetical protein CON36_34645 [Bacillus cereus]|uniref:Lipoprotein n=2 Tax=Bacillus cereus group TaxID=86661 RepID=A0A9X6SSR5_BACCE|nr:MULTISPECIES: hypothetical protein [Bacillus cereus group]PDZ94276.1 hypothetical protein CON36_34645 [Bacillus cereus]PFJ29035.1 hypothetical protein COJ15_32750 [Bacillus thuringiensis]PGP14642.1 hypothetical protein COA01_30280 [Bacillus cereus]